MSTNDVFTRADTAGAFAESGPMSVLLAENWWAIALRGVCGIFVQQKLRLLRPALVGMAAGAIAMSSNDLGR